MQALIAIAAFCQIGSVDIHHAIKHQEACQKELIQCYEKANPKDDRWSGPLKDCILKRLDHDNLTACR